MMRRFSKEQLIAAGVLTTIGLATFLFLRVGSGQTPTGSPAAGPTVNPPNISVGRHSGEVIVRGTSLFPTPSQDGQVLIAIDLVNEQLLKVDLASGILTTPFRGQVTGTPAWIRPNPTSDAVVIHWNEIQGQSAETLLYETDREPLPLPAQMSDLAWLPDERGIVYVYWEREGNRETVYKLATAKTDGSAWQVITPNLPSGPSDIALAPNGQTVAITTKQGSVDDIDTPDPLILISLDSGLIRPLPVTGTIHTAKWSADSLRLAFLKYDEMSSLGTLSFFDTREIKESATELRTTPELMAWQTNDSLLAVELTTDITDPLTSRQTLMRFQQGAIPTKLGQIEPGIIGLAIGLDGSTLILDRRTALYQTLIDW